MIYLYKYRSSGTLRRKAMPLLFCTLVLASLPGRAQQVERVADFSPWPGISQLIGYRDRIWMVNSEPFSDNNSADVYSYSIADRSFKYERSLFSQDVGAPVIYNDLLHWPFEDPRRSAGTGEYAVTDGKSWEWRAMQSGSVMHVHAMNVCDGELVAATGSWTGQLHRKDENNHWEVQYDYPAAQNRFSRVVSVAELDSNCIVGTSAKGKEEAKLFSLQGDQPVPITGWPVSERVDNLTRHQQSLFAFADSGGARQLIRYDGEQAREITLPEDYRPRAMHSDGKNLWLVAHKRGGKDKVGSLWNYADNNEFKVVKHFSHVPISVVSYQGVVAIGTYASSGASLLVYKAGKQTAIAESSQALLLQATTAAGDLDPALVDSLYDELQGIVTDPLSTANYARALRRNLSRHPEIKTPEFGAAVTRLLSVPIAGAPTTMFTGQAISRQDLIHWYLINTLAINGNGRVDPARINPDSDLITPDSKKVFDPAVATIVAAGWLQQNDKPTLRALFKRLNNSSDPLWVKADVIGALTAITDQRFAYDVAAWNSWWSRQ